MTLKTILADLRGEIKSDALGNVVTLPAKADGAASQNPPVEDLSAKAGAGVSKTPADAPLDGAAGAATKVGTAAGGPAPVASATDELAHEVIVEMISDEVLTELVARCPYNDLHLLYHMAVKLQPLVNQRWAAGPPPKK